MAKEWAKKFYNSKQWKDCREAYVSTIPGLLCEKCGERVGLEVHHVIELNPSNINDPNITLNHDNLMYLCFDCHQAITHNRKDCIAEGLKFDIDGNLIKI